MPLEKASGLTVWGIGVQLIPQMAPALVGGCGPHGLAGGDDARGEIMFWKVRSFSACAVATACLLLSVGNAFGLSAPTGDVILTVVGKIGQTNADGRAEFDLAMLENLKGRITRTKTPWMEGQSEFSGPLLREVLAAVGATGKTLKVTALNDFVAYLPDKDALEHDTILATRLDGSIMSVRDKGPLFLIYPFDREPALYNEKYFARSVWQITEIEVRE
jgi:hypothetical protein